MQINLTFKWGNIMTNEEKNILFDAICQLLINQQRIMNELKVDYDSYYTELAIHDTGRIANQNYLKMHEL